MNSRKPRETMLADTAWLNDNLDDPNLRIVDMRGYVRTVDLGNGRQAAAYSGAADEYSADHIPGAIYLDWTRDIVDPDDSVPAQVATPEAFGSTLGRLGIGDRHLIVAYDAHPAMQFATRLWWVLRYYGHEQVRVLDGGYARWVREGRVTSSEVASHAPAIFTQRPQPSWRATGEAVLATLRDPAVRVIDAREEAQFSGAIVRGNARAGHIPGAISLPREVLIDPATGRFRGDDELRAIAKQAGITPAQRVIAYCNGGVAATTVLFGLALAGHTALTNYDGSWNEWGERDDWPVETSGQPL